MKNLIKIVIILGTIVPSISFSQNKNRVSIQLGLFHNTFDDTHVINPYKTSINNSKKLRSFHYAFGGWLNDSYGVQYERVLKNNSTLSLEYMRLPIVLVEADGIGLTEFDIGPFISWKNIYKINSSFTKKVDLNNKIKWVFGVGVNYLWGRETVFLAAIPASWGGHELHFKLVNRNDFGLNIRTGFEYSPSERLTLYTNFDFLGIIILNASEGVEDSYTYFKEKYDIEYLPSRWDLSFQVGVGYNFN
jgi:hypothetical protein